MIWKISRRSLDQNILRIHEIRHVSIILLIYSPYLIVRSIDGRFICSPQYTADFPAGPNGTGGISHPQILGGGVPVTGAGEVVIQHGKIVYISNKSGHYQPSPLQMMDFVTEMWQRGFKFECKPGTVGIVGYKVWNGRVVR